MSKKQIEISTKVEGDIDNVWECWTQPNHITQWNSPSDQWHTPKAENDLRETGKFNFRMEAKDGSAGFDFSGTYDEVKEKEIIRYSLDDGRKVDISFKDENNKVLILEKFEPEAQNSEDMQREGWQAILDNFKSYVESK